MPLVAAGSTGHVKLAEPPAQDGGVLVELEGEAYPAWHNGIADRRFRYSPCSALRIVYHSRSMYPWYCKDLSVIPTIMCSRRINQERVILWIQLSACRRHI